MKSRTKIGRRKEQDTQAPHPTRDEDRQTDRALELQDGIVNTPRSKRAQARDQSELEDGATRRTTEQPLASPGEPLEPATQAEMEAKLHADFSGVKIHTDKTAQASAESEGASAYTIGEDVVFGKDRYDTDSPEGRLLLAHELAHVVQQRRGGERPRLRSDSPQEQAAQTAAEQAVRGHNPVTVQGAANVGLARQTDERDQEKEKKESQSTSRAFFRGDLGVIAEVYFPTSVSELDDQDRDALDELSDQLSNHATMFLGLEWFWFDIVGHADGRGERGENIGLSQRRANAVTRYFVSQRVFQNYIKRTAGYRSTFTEGKGELGPQRGTAEELARYRRVDIKLHGERRSVKREERPEPEPTPEPYEKLEGTEGDESDKVEGEAPEEAKPETWEKAWDVVNWTVKVSETAAKLVWMASEAVIAGKAMAVAVCVAMPVAIFGGLKALGDAHAESDKADAIIGASYGFVAAVMNPDDLTIPDAPGDVSASHFRDAAQEEAGRVQAKIEHLSKKLTEDPKDQQARKELAAFYAVYRDGAEAAQELLNETYQKNLSQHVGGVTYDLYESRYLTWPTPTVYRTRAEVEGGDEEE